MSKLEPLDDKVAKLAPGWILVILPAEFVLLAALLIGFYVGLLSKTQMSVGLIGGLLPLIVPWGGAHGGVSNALVGVSSHWSLSGPSRPSKQSSQWNVWYLVQLPLGAAFGTISTLIVVFLIGSLGKTTGGQIVVTPAGSATLLVIAFAVGYRQDVFRQLLARVTTILLGNIEDAPTSALFSVPSETAFEPTPVNSTSPTLPIPIVNDGRLLLRIDQADVTLEGPNKGAFEITTYPNPAAAGSTVHVGLVFSPLEKRYYAAELAIKVNSVEKRISVKGTGT